MTVAVALSGVGFLVVALAPGIAWGATGDRARVLVAVDGALARRDLWIQLQGSGSVVLPYFVPLVGPSGRNWTGRVVLGAVVASLVVQALGLTVGSGGSGLLEDWRLGDALPPEVWLTQVSPPSASPPGART